MGENLKMNHENTSVDGRESKSHVEKRKLTLRYSTIAGIIIALPHILLFGYSMSNSGFLFFTGTNLFTVCVPASFVFALKGLKYGSVFSKDEIEKDPTLKKVILMGRLIILGDIIFVGLVIFLIAKANREMDYEVLSLVFLVIWYGIFNEL